MIVPLKSEHIPAVVGIHRQVLADTLNARMGERHLSWLYGVVQSAPDSDMWVSIDPLGAVLGFITVSRDMHKLEHTINDALKPRQYLSTLIFTLGHPQAIKEIVSRRQFTKYLQKNYPLTLPAILTIGVSPAEQKSGIGAELLQKAIRSSTAAGFPFLYVDTRASNVGARKFYEKMGFQQLAINQGNVIFRLSLKRS